MHHSRIFGIGLLIALGGCAGGTQMSSQQPPAALPAAVPAAPVRPAVVLMGFPIVGQHLPHDEVVPVHRLLVGVGKALADLG